MNNDSCIVDQKVTMVALSYHQHDQLKSATACVECCVGTAAGFGITWFGISGHAISIPVPV